MFRLVVIHQLVLSLVVGPMLCCCTTARLVDDASPTSRGTAAGDTSPRKSCCGGQEKSPDTAPSAPGGETPGDPAKCPCKDGPEKAATAPGNTASAADSLNLLSLGVAALELPLALDGAANAARCAPRLDLRSSSLSTADLLFAHHNLRC